MYLSEVKTIANNYNVRLNSIELSDITDWDNSILDSNNLWLTKVEIYHGIEKSELILGVSNKYYEYPSIYVHLDYNTLNVLYIEN
jgi:hypothetical protein